MATGQNSIVSEAVTKFGADRENLLPVLQYIASRQRWLSEKTIVDVAQAFDLSTAEVYRVASFYTFLDTVPRGKYVVRVCRTISCDMKGKEALIHTIEDTLKIKLGETTPDNLFSFLETNCMGWCHKGPAMLVNDDVYTEVNPEKAVAIINSYKAKG
jgi:NADH:ubiquinone oxidoreductase subunit E